MREICFDTETTGLNANDGDRIIEIGAVEIENLLETGRVFRRLIYPERLVSADTVRITGITDEMLAGQPIFSDEDVYQAFLDFIGDAPLIAHNAEFDRGFLNAEMSRIGMPEFPKERFTDTLVLARKKFPGASASLDALCKRFNISLATRDVHTAVVDSQLLAKVYLNLKGGLERSFEFEEVVETEEDTVIERKPRIQRPTPLLSLLTAEENEAHKSFVESLGETAVWKSIL